MSARITPLRPGESSDAQVNEILQQGQEGWWQDSAMFGVLARNPELLKSIVQVFGSFFGPGKIEPHIHELMRLKTGQINDCAY